MILSCSLSLFSISQCSFTTPTGLFDNIQNINGPTFPNSNGAFAICAEEAVTVTGNGVSNFWLEMNSSLSLTGTNFGYIIATNQNIVTMGGSGTNIIYALAGSEVTINSGTNTVYAQCGATVTNYDPETIIFAECFPDVDNQHPGAQTLGCSNMNFNIPDPPIAILDLGGHQDVVCADAPFLLDASILGGPYNWSTGETTATILVDESGEYTCEVPGICGSEIGVAYIDIGDDEEYVFLGLTVDYCDDTLPITLDAGPGYSEYVWSNGETGQVIEVQEHGLISLEAEGGCIDGVGQIVLLGFSEPPPLNLGDDFDGCALDFPVTLDPGSYNNYSWSTSETSPTLDVYSIDTYEVTVSNFCGSQSYSWNLADYLNPPEIGLPENFSVCEEDFPLNIAASQAFQTFEWNTTETTSNISISEPGTYSVTAQTACAGTASGEVTVTSLGNAPSLDFQDITVCDVEFPITIESPLGYDSYTWSTNQNTPSIEVNSAQSISLEVSNVCGTVTDEITITSTGGVPNVNLGEDIQICEENFPLTLDAQAAGDYIWSTDETSQSITINSPQTVSITVTNACGTASDQIEIESLGSAPNLDLGPDLDVCEEEFPLQISAPGFDDYLWHTLETGDNISVNSEQLVELEVSNACGTDTDELLITSLGQLPTLDLGEDIQLCNEDFPIEISTEEYDSYFWSTSEVTPSVIISEAQDLELTVTNVCGSVSDLLVISSLGSQPNIGLDDLITICDDDFPAVISAQPGNDTYLWNTLETTSSITINGPQLLSVTAENICGTDTEDIEIISGGLPPELELGENISMCDEEFPIQIDGGVYESYFWSTSEFTQSISVDAPQTLSLTVSNFCGNTTDEITITSIGGIPELELGEDFSMCEFEFPFTYNAPAIYENYLWNTLETNPSIQIDSPQTISLEVSNVCGTTTDEVTISSAGLAPELDLGPDISLCNANFPLEIDGGIYDTYSWSTSETSQTISVNGPQTLFLMITNECGFDVDELVITSLGDAPNLDLAENQAFCNAEFPVTLQAPEGEYSSVNWSNGFETVETTVDEPGMLTLSVENSCGTDTDYIEIIGIENSEQDITLNLCEGEEILFDDLVITEPGTYSSFNPSGSSAGCGIYSNITVPLISLNSDTTNYAINAGSFIQYENTMLTEEGTYFFYDYNLLTGCYDEHVVNVRFYDNEVNVYVPSAFTPDGSGLNDGFRPTIYLGNDVYILNYEFQIFNRFGELFFQSTNYPSSTWTGNSMNNENYYVPNGLYNWTLKVQTTEDSVPAEYAGTVTILR